MNLVNRVINNKYRITEKIADGGMSTVWLAKDLSGSNTFVVKVLKKDVTSNRIEDIIRFRNEATTVSKLNEPAIAKIYEVGEEESIHYIVMEYLNGYSLQELINSGRKFTIDESVEIIYRICNALKYIHSSGVLHRDIKPGNLIINDENSRLEVKLIDFGISQVREFDINDTREIVGTLYYMSPEQSGIINRIVDERSDLYSLGVVFYQLLAYKLPFGGENLNTIIHQHIARIPDKLTKLNSNIPENLEKIVSRLLEKEPENRYQSADGLLVDLEKFRSGELDFTPGQQDKIIKLNYRTNLVGRDEEFKRLKEMFEDSLQGRGNICFISGEAGKGKTRLTEELRNYVYKKGGIFVDGKCFSGENKGPYGIFSDVINSYLKAFIKYDEKKKTNIKKKIKDSIGELGRIILKLNPRAEEILDNCPELAALEPEGENKRFQMVVSQFFCDLGLVNNNGLVIFLDDLQWIDEGSIKILNDISKQIFKYPVFIICTYRDNEVHDEHILRKFIQSKIDMGKPVEEICLKSFDKDMMQNFISRLLFDNGDNIGEVSDFILKKSNGNPFFSIEILKQMVNENALLYEKGKWHINKVALNNIQIPTSIVDILIKRILELDDEQREILSYASVVGRMFDIEFLFELTEMSKEKVIEIIDHCIKEQFLEQDHYEHGKILFVHDRLAEAFYRNIGNQKKKELHFKIASVLSDRNCANIEKVVFDLAYHFIESGDAEKALQYVYPAALKSMENHASEEAIKYFLKAAKYLEEKGEEGSDRWIECIKNSGNISIFIGKLDEAQALFQKLLPFSKASEIKAEIYHSIGMAYFDSSQHDKAVEYMKKGLKILGEHIPNGKISVSIGILKELLTLTLNQRFIGKQNYIKMQNLRNEKNKLKVSILDNLGWLYMVTDTLNYMYIKIKTVNICQSKIGLSRELVRSLANMGFILGISRSFDRAIKYFENASELSKELNNEVSFCEVNSPWGYTLQWKGDYEESARKLLEVVNTYKKIGSYIDLITSYHAFTSTLLIWGELSQAKIYIDEFLIFAQRLGGAYVISLSTFMNSWYHLVKGNIDQSLDAALESCKIAEGKELLLECIESAMIARLYLAKGNLEKGFEYIERSKRLNETNKFLYMYTNLLYIVKAELYISKFASLRDRLTKKEISALEKKVKKALRIANAKTKNLPHFIGNFLRVKAGYFAVIGSYKEAEKSFCKSIENCIRYKLKYDLAIGYYEFGLFLQKINRYDEARNNIEKSYNLFKEMSSEFYIKLCENFLGISGKEASDSTERFSQLIRTSQRMSSIVLISQKISSILDLDELLNKIMDSVIEVTGAQNACLMLIDKKTGIMKNVVSKSSDGSTVEGMQVSQNIIHKVLEKGEAVISTNAMEDERYSTMQSVVLNRLKSVLCIPIKYNDEINGVCYLDNQLSSSVFSEEDVQTLNVFMTQAAISIANAELYRMAITDGLTELITHKHFQTLLDNELERSNRYGRSFSLIMLDIDNFKKFNDTYGHQAGDQVLIHVARALKETFRNVDIVARYGGEEFAAILPETQVNSAKIAGERVRKAIENTEVIYDGMKLKVTVSIGISMFPDYAADPTSLINTADKALYRSKENGRNMVTVYQDLLLYI